MKAKEFGTEVNLSAEAIDICAERSLEYLLSTGLDKKEALRIRLSLENVLLKWQEHFGPSVRLRMSCYSHLGQPTILLKLDGDPFDPLAAEVGEYGEWSLHLLSDLQTTPMYSYSRNVNTVSFKLVKPKRSPMLLLLFSILAAAAVALLGQTLPESFRISVSEKLLTPLCDTYMGVLGFCGIPMIFLSIALGIRGIGDTAAFGRIGKNMMKYFLLSLLITAFLTAAAAYPFFSFAHGSTFSVSLSDLLSLLLSFLPTNIVAPFAESNAIQLIVVGVVCGIGLLKLAPMAHGLSSTLDDLNNLLLMAAQLITKLVPFFIFCTLVKSAWSGVLSQLLYAWKPWVITTALQIILLLIMAIQICMKYKVRLKILLQKVVSTFLVSLATNSVAIGVQELYPCVEKLGISRHISGFGIPIVTSLHKPACVIRLITLVYFMAASYQVGISVQWIVLACLICILFSVAIPAMPGGALLFYPMLFAQLGIPAEAFSAMLATDIFFDISCTAFSMVSAEFSLLQQAGSLDLLDLKILRAE